jgi:hypothetical protein
MSRIVYMTSEDPISPESIERLKRVAAMPDSEIRTDLIPERRFDLARRSGGSPVGRPAKRLRPSRLR